MPHASAPPPWKDVFATVDVIGTACRITTHGALIRFLDESIAGQDRLLTVDFTNVHIVTLRRLDPAFREATRATDLFVPDSQILTWAVRLLGGPLAERVYGPDFMERCLRQAAASTRHYFLGGSAETLGRLIETTTKKRPDLQIVGSRHGYFQLEDEPAVVEDIRRARPDFIWVGLGTPKQQAWIARNAERIGRGALLAVGFAFDVNAGTKKDAPGWMGRSGLTWLYRLCAEPRRLLGRYAFYNSAFVWFFARQLLSGSPQTQAAQAPPPATPRPL